MFLFSFGDVIYDGYDTPHSTLRYMDTINIIQADSLGDVARLKPGWIRRLRQSLSLIDSSRKEEAKMNLAKTIDEMTTLESKMDPTNTAKQANAFLLEFGNTRYVFPISPSLKSFFSI